MSRPGRERDARDELGHVGVDHLCAPAPREGDAVVTVDHKLLDVEIDSENRSEQPERDAEHPAETIP